MREVFRIIDANVNRSSEGLRVCEDIARFILDDSSLTRSFKMLRQDVCRSAGRIYKETSSGLLKSRDIKKDVGKRTSRMEKKRKNVGEILRANIQRAKESMRSMEEIAKLIDVPLSAKFKKMRYKVYELEKKSRIKLETVLHY